MTVEELSSLVKESPITIVKFGTETCMPCKTVESTLDKLQKETEGLNVIKIDAEDEPELSIHFRIRSVPVLLYYKDGDMTDKTIGNVSEQTIKEIIEKYK